MAYHSVTWLVWLTAAAYLALVNHQPLVSVLLIAAIGSILHVASRRSAFGSRLRRAQATWNEARAEGWGAFLRFGLWVWLVALAFNLLSTHAGSIVLLTLPRHWPLIGGSITLEALLYGLSSGASLFAMLLIFATFNLVMDVHRLLRWVPAGLYQAGLVVSIALAFVPQMVASLKDIREAQRIRGHRFKGLRDLIPLFVPLITTALERSLNLAESIEARGFGGTAEAYPVRGQQIWLQGLTAGGLLLLLVGLLWQAVQPQTRWIGLLLASLGTGFVTLALYVQGRHVRRTHYRREPWRPRDTWVSLACAASILLASFVRAVNPLALWYYPYPPSSPWPTFSPWLGLATFLTAMPVLLWPLERRKAASYPQSMTRVSEESND